MLIILPTWEAEIRRPDQAKISQDPSQLIAGCHGICLSPHATQEPEIRRIVIPAQPGQKFARPHLNGKKLDAPSIPAMDGNPGWAGQNMRTSLKNYQSRRATASQLRGTEFKP
jgi:hypothetical protein